ncbi:FadR/GntR family transcriptional regulator [Clostridium sp.]|jgi:GntR family transcriptional repressor for pyruvate dehydrogenase complex|uniref:FadR/GntR family transcriptional regulator n=1 Tax=Clostridium sp. TaxID=1506 RepID=UPI003EE8F5E1
MIIPVKKKNLYQEIVNQIIKMINEGVWKPGDKIPGEIELSKSFEISRNSIRESIKSLELVGILSSKTGVGTFVSDSAVINMNNMKLSTLIKTDSSMIELMETRLIIEPALVSKAVKNATEEDIKILEDIIKKSAKAYKEKNYTFDMGFEFHRYIFGMANNDILNNLLESITENLIGFRSKMFFKHLSEYILTEELNEHTELLSLIRKGDSVAAKDMMFNHIEKSLNILKARIEEEEQVD